MGAGECLYDSTSKLQCGILRTHAGTDTHSIHKAMGPSYWGARCPGSHTPRAQALASHPPCHTHNGTHTLRTPAQRNPLAHIPSSLAQNANPSMGTAPGPSFTPTKPAWSSSATAALTSAHVCRHARQCTYTHVHSHTCTRPRECAHKSILPPPCSTTPLHPWSRASPAAQSPNTPHPGADRAFAPRRGSPPLHMLLRAERARGLLQEFSCGLSLGTTQSHPLLTLPLPCYVTLRVT